MWFRFEFWHAFLALVFGVSFGCCWLMEKLLLFHDCVSLFLVRKIRISFNQNNGFGVWFSGMLLFFKKIFLGVLFMELALGILFKSV